MCYENRTCLRANDTPAAPLADQFDRRSGAEFGRGRLGWGSGAACAETAARVSKPATVGTIVRMSASIGSGGPNVRNNL